MSNERANRSDLGELVGESSTAKSQVGHDIAEECGIVSNTVWKAFVRILVSEKAVEMGVLVR